jgi:hypothetical protein
MKPYRRKVFGEEVGHMRVTSYWRIKEMIQAGVIDQLIDMGREWVKTPLFTKQTK